MASDQHRVSFPALGSTGVVVVSQPGALAAGGAPDAARATAALAAALAAVQQVVESIDRACSRFRPDSELSLLNRSGGGAVEVSPLLLEAVQAALRAARATDGDVDPTVGAALIALGYDRDFSQIDELASRQPAAANYAPVPGWKAVNVDPIRSTVRLDGGALLDLGATAKALAADLAAEAAAVAAGAGVLVSLGGDLAIAGEPPSAGWQVRVADDHRADGGAPGQSIALQSGGLATSSTTVRRWSLGDRPAHHLIDPSTGQPAAGPWRTVSVAAASCLDANIASTAALIRGAAATDWLQSLGLPSRLVARDGTVRHLAGWPSQGDDLPRSQVAELTTASRPA